jgi:hypothetical protein
MSKELGKISASGFGAKVQKVMGKKKMILVGWSVTFKRAPPNEGETKKAGLLHPAF